MNVDYAPLGPKIGESLMVDVVRVVAEPTRREILRLVWNHEHPVGTLVDHLKVTQPTVSHHLRVLRDGGLVTVRQAGNRRFYKARQEALGELRAYMESYWQDEVARLKELIESKQAMKGKRSDR